jgi:transcriptional regulator with XRE-family HTH domain
MKERLKEVRKTKGLNQKEFASELGIAQNTYSLIETGKIAMSERNIKMACLAFGISEQWLRTGEGEMFMDNDTQYEIELLDVFRQLSESSRKLVVEHAKGVAELEQALIRKTLGETTSEASQGTKMGEASPEPEPEFTGKQHA